MTSTIFDPFRPLLLCTIFISSYSGSLLASDNDSIPYPTRDHLPVTEPATLEYKWQHVEGAEEYIFSIRDQRLTRELRLNNEDRSKGIIYNADQTIKLMAADVCSEETAICKVSTADTVLLENFGRYSWRVKALKDGKRVDVKRNVFFLSAGALPDKPVIDSPRDNQAYALPSKPSFEWTHLLPAGPAEHYIVRVVDITDRSDRKLMYRAKLSVADACLLDSCSYTLNPDHLVEGVTLPSETGELLEDRKYRFTVRASNGYDRSEVARAKFTITPPVAEGTVAEGYDWSLPEYVSDPDKVNTSGGLVRDTFPDVAKPEGYTNTAFYAIRWADTDYFDQVDEQTTFPPCSFDDTEDADKNCTYGFGTFNGWLNINGGKDVNVLVRLEVNSVCDVPKGLRDEFNYYGGGSIAFWQDSYIERLKVFVEKFASKFANHPRIKGVHLGIADGEYTDIALALAEHIKAGGTYDTFNYATFCNTNDFNPFTNKNGWGEFYAQEGELKSAISMEDGLTVENFQSSVKRIIDLYTEAFNVDPADPAKDFRSKLVMTNLTNFVYNDPSITSEKVDPEAVDEFVEDEVIQAFNDIKTSKISPYALAAGVGNRDGLIEDWMSYNNPVYGMSFKSDDPESLDPKSPVGTCKMTMDENIAEIIGNRYWGTENEEYLLDSSLPDDDNYVLEKFGRDDQYYRFMMSSLRALQMRRNHMLLNTEAMYDLTQGEAAVETPYKTTDFLNYLAGTMGRSQSDTPDAFVVLGERYIRTIRTEGFNDPAYSLEPNYPEGLDGQPGPTIISELSELIDSAKASGKDALVNCTDSYTTVSEYGRWLTEVSGKGTKSNLIDLDIVDAEGNAKEPFSIPRNLPEVNVDGDGSKASTKYDYAARSSNEFLFDINDAVVSKRCDLGSACQLEIKVVFQDTVATTLSLVTEAGVVGAIETSGDDVIKTVTFTADDTFANGLPNGADFGIVTVKDAHALPVFMTRVNFLSEPATDTPVLAVVAAE